MRYIRGLILKRYYPMKNNRLFLFIFLGISQFSTLLANTIVVGKKYKIRNIQNAILIAQPTDTILINAGKYFENSVLIDKPLVIIGIGNPLIDGQFKGEIFTIKANDVSVQGICFQNVGQTSMIDWAAIKILEAKNVHIFNNKIKKAYFGIYLSASNNCLVQNNEIEGNPHEEQTTGNGIHAWKCDSLQIMNNKVSYQRDGIYFEFVTNSLIEGNLSHHNIRYGLHFMFSHKDSYISNTFSENGAGVAVMYSKHVTMKKNLFQNNWGSAAYGILLKDIDDSDIEQNVFYKNTIGIYMEGTSRVKVLENTFEENGWAMKVQANCNENVCSQNNFFQNTFDVATNGKTVLSHFDHNYWDKYEGYDLNHDKIGDIPFHPVRLFAVIIEQMPQCVILLRSFMVTLLEKVENVIPSLTPENLVDNHPLMKPYKR